MEVGEYFTGGGQDGEKTVKENLLIAYKKTFIS